MEGAVKNTALAEERARQAEEAQRKAALLAAEQKAAAEKEAAEKIAAEKAAAEKAAAEKEAADKAERERLEREKLEKERLEKERIEKEKAEAEQAKVEEAAAAAQAQAELAAKPIVAVPKGPFSKEVPVGARERGSLQALAEAEKYLERLQHIKLNVRTAVKADRQLNNYCFKAKMAITVKIGQITNSRSQVRRIANELNGVLAEAGTASPIAREWLMDVTAKQIANQAEREVAVFKPLAFPMARVVQNIVAQNPDFLDIFLGRLMKRNVYLVPKHPLRQKDESVQEYYKRIRMKKRDDDWEKDIHYEERLSGTLALYAAFLQTMPEGLQNTFYTFDHAWTWLARTLNMPPRKITALLLLTFLESTAPELVRHYKQQALKIFHFILDKYLHLMPKDSVSATTRLKLFLETHRNKLHLPEAEGFRYTEN